jgi:hypothetical protein
VAHADKANLEPLQGIDKPDIFFAGDPEDIFDSERRIRPTWLWKIGETEEESAKSPPNRGGSRARIYFVSAGASGVTA